MDFKVKDILNQTFNKRNNQISFNVRKKAMNEMDFSLDDLLELKLKKRKE